MRRKTAATLAVLAALVAAAPANSYANRAVPRGFFGAVWDGKVKDKSGAPTRSHEWKRMKGSGVESARTAFDWSFAQPTRASDISFAQTDDLVRLATAQGIELLPVVTTPPRWARRTSEAYSPPSDPRDYANYVVALIGRYGPGGSFWAGNPQLQARPIRAWEVWNEPSLHYYWSAPDGEDWAAGYGELLRVTHKAIKHADPGARVVLAGLPNTSWDALRALYERGGVKGHFDVAAVHPFTAQPKVKV